MEQPKLPEPRPEPLACVRRFAEAFVGELKSEKGFLLNRLLKHDLVFNHIPVEVLAGIEELSGLRWEEYGIHPGTQMAAQFAALTDLEGTCARTVQTYTEDKPRTVLQAVLAVARNPDNTNIPVSTDFYEAVVTVMKDLEPSPGVSQTALKQRFGSTLKDNAKIEHPIHPSRITKARA